MNRRDYLKLLGAGAAVAASDDPAGEPAAQVGRGDLDLQLRIVDRLDRREMRLLQRAAGQRRQFTRDAEHTEGMGQIGREFQGEQEVVEPEDLAHVGACHRVGRQLQQAAMVVAQLEFARRNTSPGRRQVHDRAHLRHHGCMALGATERHLDAGTRVRRTADDIEQGALPGVDLAHAQAVGVGMLNDFLDFADHDARERRRDRAQFFHLQPAHGEGVGNLLRGQRRIAEFTQPGLGKLHLVGVVVRSSG